MKPFALDQALPRGVALLEASAGTGKTYSIAGLTLRLIAEEGIPVDQLLIVTFTRAATAELADRIHRRLLAGARDLREHLAGAPVNVDDPVMRALCTGVDAGELRERLRRLELAIASFDEAAISTIHSFCQRSLQRAAFESSTDFDADMEAELGPLLEECVDDFMASEMIDLPLDFYSILRKGQPVDRDHLLALARTLSSDAQVRVLPESPGDPVQAFLRARDAFVAEWSASGADFVQALIEQRAKRGPDKLDLGKEYTKGKLAKVVATLDDYVDALERDTFVPPQLSSALQALARTRLDDKLSSGELPESPLPDLIEVLVAEPARLMRAKFAAALRPALQAKKRERGLLTFDDQLRGLRDALLDPERGPRLREVLQQNYRAALIDESQDTDAVQWGIFSRVFGADDRPLYLIGDPKQAIYSFRGADVATYLEARDSAGDQRFSLGVNWRSDAPLVDGLNRLYAAAPHLAEGIDVPAVEAAPDHAESALIDASIGAPIVLRHFPQDWAGSKKGKDYSGAYNASEAIAVQAAREVARLLDEGMQLATADGPRPLRAGDVAIIVDKHREAAAVDNALRELDIACVRSGHGSVFESEAAEAMGAWLDAVQRTRAIGRLRAVLLGPIGGLRPKELDEMDELAFDDWVERSATWRHLWLERGFLAAWQRCVDDLALQTRLLARPDGARMWTDLRHLSVLLHEAENAGQLSPAGLLRWFQRWPEPGGSTEDGHKLQLERDDDAVTITTLHASKGLEYGIVLYPTAWSSPREAPTETLRVRVPDANPPWVIDLRDPLREPEKARHIELARRADLEEAARKLYVALTRAKHQLIIYWGAFESACQGPLARLLFPGLDADALREMDDASRLERLQERIATLGGRAELRAGTELDTPPDRAPRPSLAEALTRRPFRGGPVDRDWRRSSYSSLSASATFERFAEFDEEDPAVEGVDHDQGVEDDPSTPTPEAPAAEDQVTLAGFARGAAAGTFLHEVLEHLDFQRLDEREYLLELCRQGIEDHGLAPGTAPLVARGLTLAMQTPLGGPLGDWSLAQLPRGDRVDEMSFDLPLAGGYDNRGEAGVASDALAGLFARHREPSPVMPAAAIAHYGSMRLARPLRGFLTGAIDLFFRAPDAQGHLRYFVADYKSNWLGDADRVRSTARHYQLHALADAMVHHDYHLQYHLYVLAAHRYLRSRLGEAYDYERDFGGAYYLFLRGMGGHEAEREATTGLAPGVFFDKPPLAFVDALDRLFATESKA